MGCLWDRILVWRAAERPVWPLAFIISTGSRPERRMKTRRDRAAFHTRRFSPSSPSAPVWARRRSPGRWRGSRRPSPRSPSPRTTRTPASLSRCHLGNTRNPDINSAIFLFVSVIFNAYSLIDRIFKDSNWAKRWVCCRCWYLYMTLEHKTSHKGQFFKINKLNT